MDFFEQQKRAQRKTRWLVGYFLTALAFITLAINLLIWLVFRFFMSYQGSSVRYIDGNSNSTGFNTTSLLSDYGHWLISAPGLTTSSIVIGVILAGSFYRWLSLRDGGLAMMRLVGARFVSPDTNDQAERRLINVVEEMAIASGSFIPYVYVMENESSINAFVAGNHQDNTVLVVTQGALNQLSRQELQGVVAHEFSHIFYGDVKINMQLVSVLAGILLISQSGRYIIQEFSPSAGDADGRAAVAVFSFGTALFAIGSIGLFLGRLIKAAISRQREFLADAAAIQFARDNTGLADALIKIDTHGSFLHNSHNEETSHMCIVEPRKLAFQGMASHPPIQDRLNAIMKNADLYLQEKKRQLAQQSTQHPSQDNNNVSGAVDAVDATNTANTADNHPVTQRIGNPNPFDIESAAQLLVTLPVLVTQAAHSPRNDYNAVQLILALLFCENGTPNARTEKQIVDTYDDKTLTHCKILAQQLSEQFIIWRLPITELAMPSLRRLSPAERKTFIGLLNQLIKEDDHVTQFEYVLHCLIIHTLSPKKKSRPTINRLAEVLDEIQLVFSVLINSNGHKMDNHQKQQLFETVWQQVSFEPRQVLATQFDAQRLHQCLTRLDCLSLSRKQFFLEQLEAIAMHDNTLNTDETEILRAIAAFLDCPIPLTVTQYNADKFKQLGAL